MKKGNKILVFMLVAAAIALGFGFYVMNQRVQAPQVSEQNQENNSNDNVTPPPVPPAQPEEIPLVSTTNWKVYENDKHVFSLKYPSNLKAGSISDNSVLGTVDAPVRGFHVGPLVLVVLKDPTLKKEAQDYFNGVYSAATSTPAQGQDVAVECKADVITNSGVVSIKSASCTGEGGPAKYAYIQGPAYDVFVDGYSKGYDNQANGEFASASEYVTVLSTFRFSNYVSTETPIPTPTTPPASSTTPPTTPPTPPTIQSFAIAADDNTATPSEISVAKDAIVQITFNVGSNVYYGGLDFKSNVVNSGTIAANNSKTISFKATESFFFTPYWPASSIAKNYTIKVNVQ
jgi:hypothetical protein